MSLSYETLNQTIPDVREVVVSGKPYHIKRFGLRKLKDAAVHAAYIAMLLEQLNTGESPLTLMIQGGDAAIDLMALALDEKPSFFDDVDPTEGANLFLAVLEVNVDFFVNTLSQSLPQLNQRLTNVIEKIKTAAANSKDSTSSNSST